MNTDITELALPGMQTLPRPVYVRQQRMPPRHLFATHQHPWHQLLFATAGTLVANLKEQRLFVPSGTAVWLPAGCEHSTYTEFGAELKSLYIEADYTAFDRNHSPVLEVSSLMRELILTAAGFDVEYPLDGYENQLMQLMLHTLSRLAHKSHTLPWPADTRLAQLCTELYADPARRPMLAQTAAAMAMSPRTLERRFQRETGMTLQAWCSRMRLMKAIEMLSTDMSVTQMAFELGYSSPAPFILMFREQLGMSPNRYRARIHTAKPIED